MGEFEKRQIFEEVGFKDDDKSHSERVQWAFMETEDDVCKYDLNESSLDDSLDSSSSTEMMEDVSSTSSSSSSSSCSPLFDLSELMLQLPIKRGLSKFYQGKSESFASLASVKSIEDLEKKCKYSCRSRSMKRYGQSQSLSPKATIAKNKKGFSSSSSPSSRMSTSRSSMFSSVGKMSSLMAN